MSRGEWSRTTAFIDHAVEILERENPMTVRQLFYRLVSDHTIENCDRDYGYVSRMMTKARQDGRVDYDWIVDRSRPEYMPSVWDDVAGYAQAVSRSYRKDYWSLQPRYVELWSEKDTITGSIQDITDSLGVRVVTARGYNSTTRMYEAAKRLQAAQSTGKDCHLLYLGDWDPSGADMERDVEDRLRHHRVDVDVQRLAILKLDISKFKLPPLRVKVEDTRADKFRDKHGDECVELDALPPSVLRQRIQVAVERLLDKPAWDRAVAVESAELASIQTFASKLTDQEGRP